MSHQDIYTSDVRRVDDQGRLLCAMVTIAPDVGSWRMSLTEDLRVVADHRLDLPSLDNRDDWQECADECAQRILQAAARA